MHSIVISFPDSSDARLDIALPGSPIRAATPFRDSHVLLQGASNAIEQPPASFLRLLPEAKAAAEVGVEEIHEYEKGLEISGERMIEELRRIAAAMRAVSGLDASRFVVEKMGAYLEQMDGCVALPAEVGRAVKENVIDKIPEQAKGGMPGVFDDYWGMIIEMLIRPNSEVVQSS